jgi:hypothetical protein
LTGGRLSGGFPNFQHFDDIAHLPKALELFPLIVKKLRAISLLKVTAATARSVFSCGHMTA